jgi:uncharacterized membrane protein
MKRYFVTGLLIWIPLGITLWVISTLVGAMDSLFLLLPGGYRPAALLGFHLPGLGLVIIGLVLLLTGFLAANIIGQRLVRWWEGMMQRIPVVKSIYGSVKQVSDTLLSPSGQAFRQAVLVRFPHRDSWTVAFLTGAPTPGIACQLPEEHIAVFVPTTPNPTSGYLVIVPKADTLELDISVDEALKYVISMGVVAPAFKPVVAKPVIRSKMPDLPPAESNREG